MFVPPPELFTPPAPLSELFIPPKEPSGVPSPLSPPVADAPPLETLRPPDPGFPPEDVTPPVVEEGPPPLPSGAPPAPARAYLLASMESGVMFSVSIDCPVAQAPVATTHMTPISPVARSST